MRCAGSTPRSPKMPEQPNGRPPRDRALVGSAERTNGTYVDNPTATTPAQPCKAITAAGRYAQVPVEVLAVASPRAMQVYALIARHAGADGRAWPSQSHLAVDARCGLRTVERAVAELLALGALEIVEQLATPGGAVNVYRLAVVDSTPEVAATGDGNPVDNNEVAAIGGGRVTAIGGGRNESHGTKDPHARVRVREAVQRDQHGRDVDQLLERLPARITRTVAPHHRRRLADQLTRTDRSTAWLARQLNEGPDIGQARSPGGVLVHRLAALVDEHTAQEVAA